MKRLIWYKYMYVLHAAGASRMNSFNFILDIKKRK